jgi:hypothetical protein
MTAKNVLELPLARRCVVEGAGDIPLVKASRRVPAKKKCGSISAITMSVARQVIESKQRSRGQFLLLNRSRRHVPASTAAHAFKLSI